MDLYGTSAGAISQGNTRRRGQEQAQANESSRLSELGKSWSNAQKSFEEQRDSNVAQVEQSGELREIKDQVSNGFAVSSMPSKIASYQKWASGGVDALGSKLTSPVRAGEQAIKEAGSRGASSLASRGAGESTIRVANPLAEGRPSISNTEHIAEMVGKDGKAGAGSSLMEGARSAMGMSEKTAERLSKGAGMLGGAVVAGNDIATDLAGGFGKMNTLEKVSNVSGIIGGVADVGGAFFPPLELLGGVAGLVSGVAGAIGDFEDTLSQKDDAESKTLDRSKEGGEEALIQSEASKVGLAGGGGSVALGRTS